MDEEAYRSYPLPFAWRASQRRSGLVKVWLSNPSSAVRLLGSMADDDPGG